MKDDGGPAFPLNSGHWDDRPFRGMTLLDRFAVGALPALVRESADGELFFENVACDAYSLAEAMLTERRKRQRGER